LTLFKVDLPAPALAGRSKAKEGLVVYLQAFESHGQGWNLGFGIWDLEFAVAVGSSNQLATSNEQFCFCF
jgi:hypothetical protein